jgi:hypothetical protein
MARYAVFLAQTGRKDEARETLAEIDKRLAKTHSALPQGSQDLARLRGIDMTAMQDLRRRGFLIGVGAGVGASALAAGAPAWAQAGQRQEADRRRRPDRSGRAPISS